MFQRVTIWSVQLLPPLKSIYLFLSTLFTAEDMLYDNLAKYLAGNRYKCDAPPGVAVRKCAILRYLYDDPPWPNLKVYFPSSRCQ